MRGDALFGPLVDAVLEAFPDGTRFMPRSEPAPWRKWGDIGLEESAVTQMRNASLLSVAVRGALMPDAHTGYGLPIGGVLSVKGAVIPYAVGVDIVCRMRLTVLDTGRCIPIACRLVYYANLRIIYLSCAIVSCTVKSILPKKGGPSNVRV